jgi:rod shape determining protein RodA
MIFLNPQIDPLGAGYNVTQSILAVGSGQFFGRGLSLGSQSQLNFLPEQETDFIFAVIAEELGVVGAGILLLLFLSLFLRIYYIAKNYSDDFGSLLTFGILTYLIIQVFVNIGMNIGIAPVAGVPLPFISAGGSSLVSILMAMGIIHNVYRQNRRLLFGR